jgi:ELWxxDGT repeat protein
MKTGPLFLATAMLLLAACTVIAQDGKYKIPPSNDVLPGMQHSLPLNPTANREKFLQRMAKRNGDTASLAGKDSIDINEVKKNPALFKELVLDHKKDLTPFTKPYAVAGGQLGNAGSISPGFHLTKDINALAGSFPNNSDNFDPEIHPAFAVLNNVVYFAADDGVHGSELWRSDGTEAGTYMLKDIVPGGGSSQPLSITAANGKLYFRASTFDYGSEPWVSDGTESGTQLLLNIEYNGYSSYPRDFVACGNYVYFMASTGFSSDARICRTDGTTAGTTYGGLTQGLLPITAAGNYLYFVIFNPYTGSSQFWSMEGNSGNQTLLLNGSPLQLTSYASNLYFAYTNADGTESRLWVSDGTLEGTKQAPNNHDVRLTDFNTAPFAVVDSILYVTGFSANNTPTLYKYSAFNNKGLVKVKDFGPGASIVPTEMTGVGKTLYFKVSNSNDTTHSELWSSKGTAASTQLIQSFEPIEDFYNLYNGDGILYFVKSDTTYGAELWRLVKSATGPSVKLVSDIFKGQAGSNPYYFTASNGKLFFSGTDEKKGNELCISGGNAGSTTVVKDIQHVTTPGSDAGLQMTALRNKVIFTAFDYAHGSEPFMSDGTKAGTHLLSNIRPGDISSSPFSYLSKGRFVYFIAYTADSTYAIFKTNGTREGLQKITPDQSKYTTYIQDYDIADNGIVFYLLNNSNDYQLWRSDGTATGTFMLSRNVYNGVTVMGNTAFFDATDALGSELRKSDGTIAGTVLVKDITPGSSDVYPPQGLIVYNNELYFSAFDGNIHALWKTDGTNTVRIKDSVDINSWTSYCISNNELYFSATSYPQTDRTGLWKTNGTTAGTTFLQYVTPQLMVDVNGTVYFSVPQGGFYGSDLWKSDGTSKGTQIVKDYTNFDVDAYIAAMVNGGGKLYFIVGQTLFTSDGTEAGTVQADDAVISKVVAKNLVAAGNKLFVSGYTPQYGTELYEGTIDSTTATMTITKVVSEKAVPAPASFGAVLYPNPAITVARLQLTGSTQNVSVAISNISGVQLWKSSNINSSVINLPTEKLAAGTYIVTVTNGKENKVMKLVVSRR